MYHTWFDIPIRYFLSNHDVVDEMFMSLPEPKFNWKYKHLVVIDITRDPNKSTLLPIF